MIAVGVGASGSPMERKISFSPAAARLLPSICTAHLSEPSPFSLWVIDASFMGALFVVACSYRQSRATPDQVRGGPLTEHALAELSRIVEGRTDRAVMGDMQIGCL